MSDTNWDDFKGLGWGYNNPQDIEDSIQKMLEDFAKSNSVRQKSSLEPDKLLPDTILEDRWKIVDREISSILDQFLMSRKIFYPNLKSEIVEYTDPWPDEVTADFRIWGMEYRGGSPGWTSLIVLKSVPEVLHFFMVCTPWSDLRIAVTPPTLTVTYRQYNLPELLLRQYRLVPDSVDTPKP